MSHTRCAVAVLSLIAVVVAAPAPAQDSDEDRRLAEAIGVLGSFTSADDATAIPAELLERARGIAVIPNVFRGGFIIGARRGRGVISVRTEDGGWSSPAFITLTGGSIGWQVGGETTDLVLVFANDNAVRNIASGKFTLGGDAAAVAGPLGRQATLAVTFKAEVYSYVRSRGLFAGAAFEGARLDVDEEQGFRFYGFYEGQARPLGPVVADTPPMAREFVQALAGTLTGTRPRQPAPAQVPPSRAPTSPPPDDAGARTFPLGN